MQKASGALYHKKSDVISKTFRLYRKFSKAKATPSKQITLKADYFKKLHGKGTGKQVRFLVLVFLLVTWLDTFMYSKNTTL